MECQLNFILLVEIANLFSSKGREKKVQKIRTHDDPADNKRSYREISLHNSVVGLVPLPQSLFDGVLVRQVRIRGLGRDLVPEANLAVPAIGLKQKVQN